MNAEMEKQIRTKEIHLPVTRGVVEKRRKGFFGRLKDFLLYRRKFEFMEDYYLWYEPFKKFIFIPKTFIYDGASVPKALYSIYSPNGILLLGAGPHDFGYRYKGLFLVSEDLTSVEFVPMSKRELDIIFKDLNQIENGMKTAVGTATLGLTLFGFTGWNENRRNESNLREDFPYIHF